MTHVKRLMGLAALAGWALAAEARRIAPEDAGYVIESYSERYTGALDGRSESDVDMVIRILSAVGAERAGLQRLAFNSATQDLKLVEAYTQNATGRVPVDLANVEIRSVYAGGVGFDDIRRMLVPFPQVGPGSKLVLKTRLVTHTPSLANTLQSRLNLPGSSWIERAEFVVNLPKGTRLAARDPQQRLRLERRTLKDGAVFIIKNAEPLAPELSLGEDDRAPAAREDLWLDVSSAADWGDVSERLTPLYEAILAEPLPDRFARISRRFVGQTPKIAAAGLWEAFIREVRYFGDWRTVKGAYVPRSLKLIAESGYGDCKDFAVLLTRGFRALGLKAWVGIVERGSFPTELGALPNLAAFNHAVAFVEIDGRAYIVDGTNPVTHLGVVPNDVANRPFLALDGSRSPNLDRRIPANTPEQSRWVASLVLSTKAAPSRKMRVGLEISGVAAWDVQNFLYGKTQGQTRDAILNYLHMPAGTASDFKFTSIKHQSTPEFRSTLEFTVSQDYGLRRSGTLLSVPVDPLSEVVSILTAASDNRVSALALDDPSRKITILNIADDPAWQLVGRPSPCRVTSPWFDFERTLESKDGELRVRDEFSNRVPKIEPEDVAGPTFAKIREDLRRCLLKVDLVYKVGGDTRAP